MARHRAHELDQRRHADFARNPGVLLPHGGRGVADQDLRGVAGEGVSASR